MYRIVKKHKSIKMDKLKKKYFSFKRHYSCVYMCVCVYVCVCKRVINTQAQKQIYEKGQFPSPWITAHL